MNNSTLSFRKIELKSDEKFSSDCTTYIKEYTKREKTLMYTMFFDIFGIITLLLIIATQNMIGTITKCPVMYFEFIIFICLLVYLAFGVIFEFKIINYFLKKKYPNLKQLKALYEWGEFFSEECTEIYERNGKIYRISEDEDITCVTSLNDIDKQILIDNPDCEVFFVKWNEDKSDWILEKNKENDEPDIFAKTDSGMNFQNKDDFIQEEQ